MGSERWVYVNMGVRELVRNGDDQYMHGSYARVENE